MITISMRSNIQEVIGRQWIAAKKSEQTKATARALNKIAQQAKTQVVRDIRAMGYGIKIGAIKKQLSIRKANKRELTAILAAKGKPIPLIDYGARQIKAGVKVNVKNGRKLIKGAFIATMPGGHKGVFIRVGKTHKRVNKDGQVKWEGLPIKQLFGPGVPKAFENEIVQRALVDMINRKFPDVFAHELAYVSRK